MQRIFLIGYMGAGKTTVGRYLAQALNLSLIDLDHFIEKRYNKSISQIFTEKGEEKFREIESKVLDEVSAFEDAIISTGGGAPCFFNNMERMKSAGTTVYLKTSAEELARRLEAAKNSRPLLRDKSGEELRNYIAENLRKREPFYNQAKIIFEAEHLMTDADAAKNASRLAEILSLQKHGEDNIHTY